MTFADERGSSRAYSMPGPRNLWKRGKSVSPETRSTSTVPRDATRQEIEHLKRKNYDLKQLVADLSYVEVHRFKKTVIPTLSSTRAEVSQSNTGQPDHMEGSKARETTTFPWRSTVSKKRWTRAPAHERLGEVERHNPGGTDPMGKTEAPRPTAGAQEHLLPVAGP